jgi:hypothetical protein
VGKVKDLWLNAKDFHPSGKSLMLPQNMTRRDMALLKASLVNREAESFHNQYPKSISGDWLTEN